MLKQIARKLAVSATLLALVTPAALASYPAWHGSRAGSCSHDPFSFRFGVHARLPRKRTRRRLPRDSEHIRCSVRSFFRSLYKPSQGANRMATTITRPMFSISVRYLHLRLEAGDRGCGMSVSQSPPLSNSHQPQA
jgi:hypothetical protein